MGGVVGGWLAWGAGGVCSFVRVCGEDGSEEMAPVPIPDRFVQFDQARTIQRVDPRGHRRHSVPMAADTMLGLRTMSG